MFAWLDLKVVMTCWTLPGLLPRLTALQLLYSFSARVVDKCQTGDGQTRWDHSLSFSVQLQHCWNCFLGPGCWLLSSPHLVSLSVISFHNFNPLLCFFIVLDHCNLISTAFLTESLVQLTASPETSNACTTTYIRKICPHAFILKLGASPSFVRAT